MMAGFKYRVTGVLLAGALASCSGDDGGTKVPDAGANGADGSVSLTTDSGPSEAGPAPSTAPDAGIEDAGRPALPPEEAGVVVPPVLDAATPPIPPDAGEQEATTASDTSTAPPALDAAIAPLLDAGDSGPSIIPVGPGPVDAGTTTEEPEPPQTETETTVETDACAPGGCAPPPLTCTGCQIDDVCYENGTPNPQNSCQICDSVASQTEWRARNNGTRCTDGVFCNGSDSCNAGTCSVHAGVNCSDGISCNGVETCNEGQNTCQAGTSLCEGDEICDSETSACIDDCTGCVIDDTCYPNGANPGENECLVCNTEESTTEWTSREGDVCSDDGEICQADTCACPEGFIGPGCAECVVYVDREQDDENTGLTWDDALASVQAGLDLAAERVAIANQNEDVSDDLDGCQVWVRQGTYLPTSRDDESLRNTAIRLRSTIDLYGGFAGDETALEQRDWVGNLTLLSGDHEDDDDRSDPSTSDDNSYHVVEGANNARIDGFVISGGVADGDSPSTRSGGGIYLSDTTDTTIQNCRVAGNRAAQGGGLYAEVAEAVILDSEFIANEALFIDDGNDECDDQECDDGPTIFATNGAGGGVYLSSSEVDLTSVIFDRNRADVGGGGIAIVDSSAGSVLDSTFSSNLAGSRDGFSLGGGALVLSSAPVFANTTFEDNAAFGGGGVFNGDSLAAFVNCTFVANEALFGGGTASVPIQEGNDGGGEEGGGVGGGVSPANRLRVSPNSTGPEYSHCTFFDNSASNGGAVFVAGRLFGPDLNNSIIWGNAEPAIEDQSGSARVTYTLVTGDWPGVGNFSCDPQFVDEENGDLHLQSDSPAIDASNPAGTADAFDLDDDGLEGELLPTDKDGASRAVDGDNKPPTLADLGAYEAQTSVTQPLAQAAITNVSPDLSEGFCASGDGEYVVTYTYEGSPGDALEVTSEVIAPSTVVTGLQSSATVDAVNGEVIIPASHTAGYSAVLAGRTLTTRIALSQCGDLIDERHVVSTCDDEGETPVDTVVGGSAPLEVSESGWQWIANQSMICADGSSTGYGVNLVPGSKELVVFLDGGGACMNPFTCAILQVATNFNEDAFDARMTLLSSAGVFQRGDADNPIANMSWVYVPYCTGDVHAGNHVSTDPATEYNFVGHRNVGVVIDAMRRNYPTLDRLVVTGGSAGGYGTMFNFDQAAGSFGEAEAQLMNDSGPLFPSPTMDETFETTLYGAWDVDASIPALCPTVAPGALGNLADLYGCLANLYPSSRFGLVTSDGDATNRQFAPAPLSEAQYGAAVGALTTQLSAFPQWSIFVQDSTAHVLSLNNPLSGVRASDDPTGKTLSDFMRGVLNGGDDFGNVLP